MVAAIICESVYILFCIRFAKWNADRIKQDKIIRHAINGAIHLVLWGAAFWITRNWLLLAVMPFAGRLFFDTALDLFRDIPISYVPKKSKSIIDKIERGIFGNDGLKPKLLYATAFITINCFLILHHG